MRNDHQPIIPPPPALPPRRRPRQKANRYLPWLVIGGSVAVGAAMLLAMILLLGVIYLSQPRIASGVTVASIDIGGKSVDAAASALQQSYGNPSVMVTDQDRSWPLTLADLGVTLDVEGTLAQAEDAPPGAAIAPLYKINLEQTANALVALSEQANVNPNPPESGRAIDIPVMINRLMADANGELADGVLELSMIEVEPPEVETQEEYTGPTTIHVVEPGQELALIARQYGVDMEDIVVLNNIANPDLLFVGQELVIPASGEYQPSPENAPPAPTSNGKAIVVSVGEQRIYAYENGRLVRSHLVSTGRQVTPTVLGDYNIYVKYVADDMAGPDYFLPQVPYVMYFYQGYGIHGTYWHNSFGRPMSHGCVNLPVDEAQWFFNFADVGTLVRVI
jgi:lipoprotein-anchoring transpeptidase ErfK/SrfK